MGKRLTEQSIDLLAAELCNSQPVVILGVITDSDEVLLFRGGPHLSVENGIFCGHADLLSTGVAPPNAFGGFSIYIKDGKIAAFYRQSVLNRTRERFCLTPAEVDDILLVLETDREDNFKVYPRYPRP